MCEALIYLISTTPFRKIKIGERFRVPKDPNVYIKTGECTGITTPDDGFTIICGSTVRVYRWP